MLTTNQLYIIRDLTERNGFVASIKPRKKIPSCCVRGRDLALRMTKSLANEVADYDRETYSVEKV